MIGRVGARGARVLRKEKRRVDGMSKRRKGEVRMTMMNLGLGRWGGYMKLERIRLYLWEVPKEYRRRYSHFL